MVLWSVLTEILRERAAEEEKVETAMAVVMVLTLSTSE